MVAHLVAPHRALLLNRWREEDQRLLQRLLQGLLQRLLGLACHEDISRAITKEREVINLLG